MGCDCASPPGDVFASISVIESGECAMCWRRFAVRSPARPAPMMVISVVCMMMSLCVVEVWRERQSGGDSLANRPLIASRYTGHTIARCEW